MDRKIDTKDEKIDTTGSPLNRKTDEVDKSLSRNISRLAKKGDSLDRRSEQRHEVVIMALGSLVDYTEVRER